MDMNLLCVMMFDYGSVREAKAVAGALEPDNEGFVTTVIKENVLEATAKSDTVEGLRHTLDDFLACLKVAEEAVGVVRAAPSEDDSEE